MDILHFTYLRQDIYIYKIRGAPYIRTYTGITVFIFYTSFKMGRHCVQCVGTLWNACI
jgi:hypothetical protein